MKSGDFMVDIDKKPSEKQSVLFITYDGLLDQLGASQILPYIFGIAAHPRRVHILSFEKPVHSKAEKKRLRKQLAERGIEWSSLPFTPNKGIFPKAWDLNKMYLTALRLQIRHRFGIVHCRSYQAMQVGRFLRRWTSVKAIFDMRGLWVDDRIDRGIWSPNRPTHFLLFRYYKRVERRLLQESDSTIVLAEKIIAEMPRISENAKAPITVIPCCADFEHFVISTAQDKMDARAILEIDPNARLMAYLGSLGQLYLLDEMLLLFKELAEKHADVHFLVITRDWNERHEDLIIRLGLSKFRCRIHIKPANRDQVPRFLGACDVMLSLIRPTFSMRACSPTKVAEALAMGVPVIANRGVGDMEELIPALDAGAIIDVNDPGRFEKVVSEFDKILAKGGVALRKRARVELGLELARKKYCKVYQALEVNR